MTLSIPLPAESPCRTCTLVRWLAGCTLALVMAAIGAGKLLMPEAMAAHVPLLAEIRIGSAIALSLAGVALVWPRGRRGLGWGIAAIGGAMVLQYVLPRMLPDWAARVPPLSVFSMLCIGLSLAMLDRPGGRAAKLLLQAVPLLILTAAVVGVLNRELGGLLFAVTANGQAAMSLATAAGLIAFIVGYVAAMLEMPWFIHFYAGREERQVLAIGLAGLIVALLLSGAAVVGVLGSQVQKMTEQQLAVSLQVGAASHGQVVDAGQLHGPLRRAVWLALGLIAFIGFIALTLTYRSTWNLMRRSLETGRQLRGVLEALPVGVWLSDASGRIVLGNPAGRRIWAGERYIGIDQYREYKAWWNDSGKPIGPHDWALARAIERGETSIDEILDIECFDGSRKTISNSALPLRDEQGNIVGGVAVNQDITQRLKAEAALNASRDLLRLVVENVPIRVFWKDNESRYLGCNSLFARDAGMCSPEEVIGKDDFQMAWREQAPLYRADDKHVMRFGEPKVAYEEVQTTPDGRVIWVRTSKVPLRDANGEVFGVLGIYDDVTEAKLATEELRYSQRNLVEAQRIGHMGSWELDLVHDLLTWSDEIFRIFEIDKGRFGASYEAFLNAVHPDDREMVNSAYLESVKNRTPYEIEHRLLMPDGRIKHVLERCETLYAIDGRPLQSIGTVQDITERKQTEAEICRLEEEFHSLVENLPDMVVRFDRELRHVYVNPETARTMGLPRATFIGRTHHEIGLLGNDMADLWENVLRRVFHTGEPEAFECRYSQEGGIVKYFQVRAVPEFDTAARSVDRVLVVARDVSALKGAQEVLRESEERFQAMTANVPGMVFQCYRRDGDRRLRFVYVSDGAEILLGASATAMQQDENEFLNRIAEEDLAGFYEGIDRSQAELSLWNWEGRIVVAEGDVKWINLRATPRRYSKDVCMWDGVAINVTQSKLNTEKLVLTQNMLRDLSAHQEDVREQERKNIAREIHDELGQTLTALRMDVSLARLHFADSNPELVGHLQSMTRLVDQTIEIARHVTASLRPAALDLGIVAALEWLVEEFIGHAGISCELVLDDGDMQLSEPVATAVFRIVQESLTNITRHAEATQVEVIVTPAQGGLRLEICDNGKGFDPQARAGKKSFGLVGMRERVAMLQGEFMILSTPGQGTCVRIFVPVT